MIDFIHSRRPRFVTLVGGAGNGERRQAPEYWPLIVKRIDGEPSVYWPMHFGDRTVARCDELSQVEAVGSLLAFYRLGELKPQEMRPGSWLFLGGPMDGRSELVTRFPVKALVPLPPATAWIGEGSPGSALKIETVDYRPELLAVDDHRFRLALVESLSYSSAIDLLIANYRPPRLKPLGPL